MKICETVSDIQSIVQTAKEEGSRIGLIPTMGALHDGHLSLVELAKKNVNHVVVSIFVNPTQFAPDEDFDSYPRNIDRDVSLLNSLCVDAVFMPTSHAMYPDGPVITVKAGSAAKGLESDFRPHFFDGVCTVVNRLFEIVAPNVAVFGEKDYQQLMVIREMVQAHNLGIEILGAPIVRDEYGLALSSRNAYLGKEELDIARELNKVLRSDAPTPETIIEVGFDKVDYIEERWGRRLVAAWVGTTRLIDNIGLRG